MTPDSVTLIVKAPNQQIEDQNIQCLSSWTVKQLKTHLSEVYPSKPSTDEQKIIYSGQLLSDNTVLKDVLRTYESQLGHTMHLVCTPKRMMEPQCRRDIGQDGLRRRNVEQPQPVNVVNNEPVTAPEVARPEMRQNDQNHTMEMHNYLSSVANNYERVPPYPNHNFGESYLVATEDPDVLANRMMMMHQAYLQYMQYYANMWQATAPAPPPNPQPAPPHDVPPAAPAPAPEDVDDAQARDWLDHVYGISRIGILLTLVYLYGSPARLVFVLGMAAAGYLHQIGFFRDLQVNPIGNINLLRNNNQPRLQQRPADQPQPNVEQARPNVEQPQPNVEQPQPNVEQTQPNVEQARPNVEQPQLNVEQARLTVNPVNQVDENQSLLAVTWMIFASFFASLIPEPN